MSEFLTYSKFFTKEEAEEFTKLLEQSQIQFKIVHEKGSLDKIFIGETLDPMIAVKIPGDRFEDANKISLAKAQSDLTGIDPDYYLLNFSNDELIEVLKNKNDWNYFDQALAQKILLDRKVQMPPIEKVINYDTYAPSRLENKWIVLEYLFSILFGYVGILIGALTVYSYKTLRSGKKVMLYDESTRYHGKIMLVLGIFRTAFLFLLPLLK